MTDVSSAEKAITLLPVSAPLFGRSSEMGRLTDLLGVVTEGIAGAAIIEGDPGVGKSSVLAEMTARAAGRGFRIFAGRAEDLDDRPFLAIAEALGVRAAGDDRRRDLSALLRTGASDGALYRILDAFEDLVEAEALRGPVLLTIDDLQWADAGTVRVLGGIARRAASLPLAIVVTLRPTPRRKDLGALTRRFSPGATRVSLQSLDDLAIVELVEARLGAPPGPKLRAHLNGAGGNPFYVMELLDALQAEDAIKRVGAAAEIESSALPPSLVPVLLYRLSGLPDAALALLRTAAVLGASFRVDDLATAAEIDHAATQAAVQLLRSEGLLTDDADKVRFRHDLIREAVYEDLGEPARMSMHGRIGRLLAGAGARPLDIASHLVRGSAIGDVEAASWLIEASDDPGVDAVTAVALLERALEIDPQRPTAVRRLARLLLWLGRPAAALPLLQRLVAETSDPRDRLGLIELLVNAAAATGRRDDFRSWVKQGSALAEQLDQRDRPETLCLTARFHFYADDVERALALTDRAVASVAGMGDWREAEALNQSSWLSTCLGRASDAALHSERAKELADSTHGKSVFWRHHAFALGDLDRIDEADTALAVARTIAEENGLLAVLLSIMVEAAHLRYSTGRWDDALAEAESALSGAEGLNIAIDGTHPDGVISWIAYHRLENLELVPKSAALTITGGRDALRGTLDAQVSFESGDLDGSRRSAAELIQRISGNAPKTQRRVFDLLPILVRIALATGDVVSARLGRDFAFQLANGSDAPGVLLAAERCRATVDGDVDAAKRVVELARMSPRPLLAAQALEDAAAVLDPSDATAILEEAAHLYGELGAKRDHARVAARLADLGGQAEALPSPRATSGWDALTPAELNVVHLAVDGLTNREIGAKLFVSHRTVATHLSHAFDKLGLRSRVELARVVTERSAPRLTAPRLTAPETHAIRPRSA